MKGIKLTLIIIPAVIIAACSSAKKSASTASSVPAATTAPAPVSNDYLFVKPAEGIYAPGDGELAAIQVQFKDVTLEKLKQGHAIYTKGACVNCHGAANIYWFDESKWKYLIDDMAQRAQLSEADKDAVYKYVLAIKAKQPK